ncbi:MAG: bifunctional phosphoglucose/phosphomannose isomerase [Candidatus Marinimicrobia bacterium]|nr:bifunctional phosphoglucose/phosphomannose isomerase [Candidatus Neomarinimicrobiota bacterium]
MDNHHAIDPDNMYKSIYDFPYHIAQALDIGRTINFHNTYDNIQNIVIAGMGGSAIGGDVVKLLTKNELKVPFVISRNYKLPNWVNENTLVICSSYSGDTEETLDSFDDSLNKGAKIIGISTGGTLTKLLIGNKLDVVTIPSGLQPRAALALSFVPMLCLLNKLGFISSNSIKDLKSTVSLLNDFRDKYYNQNEQNPTYAIAQRIYKTIPIIYGENEYTGIIALRWKGQLSENSKMLAFCNDLPEMNHNEIVGWENNNTLMDNISVIWLKDKDDHPRIISRQTATKDIIGKIAANHEVVSLQGDTQVERLLHLVHFGDWLSYWCAILHKTDPTPVKKIDHLKRILSKIS